MVKLFQFISLLGAAIFAFAAANLSPVEEQPPQVFPLPTVPEYYLKTKVLSGDTSKDGLYLSAYHTGAGFNDATLTSDLTIAAKGYYNETGTNQEFDLGTEFPWGIVLTSTVFYNQWFPVEINAGTGDPGFSINGSGLITSNEEWRGWLACDWAHGVPQLFWQYYFTAIDIPCNCAVVELCAILTSEA